MPVTARSQTAEADVGHRSLPPSEYAGQMPLLREFAGLPSADPRRTMVREQLIMAHLPVVEHLARRHGAGGTTTREELVQVGTVALINAIDRWDPVRARGEFLGYLVPCVRGEMLRWFRDRTWATTVPRRLKELSTAVAQVTGPLSQELGRAPRPSELAARLNVEPSDVVDALGARSSRDASRLDAVDSDTGTAPIDRLGAADAALDAAEFRHALRPLLDALPARERTILTLRFFGEMTQTQIAEQVGISQMHVSRLLAKTLADLRTALTVDP